MKIEKCLRFFTLFCSLFFIVPGIGNSTTYQVGPGRTYTDLQSVAAVLQHGDIVEVDGDHTYSGGVTFTQAGTETEPITIRGIRVNGNRPIISGGTNTVHFMTDYPYSGPGADHYIFEGFEVTGGSSRCIFHQADDLTIRDTVVRDCPGQGILGADQGSGSLTMQYVEVYNCGAGTYRHQIYMATDEVHYPGSVFRMEHCYIHDGNGGNNVKTRAERNEIYYNWIEGAYYHELEMIGPDGGDGGNPGLAREDSDVVGNVFRKTGSHADFYVFRVGGDGTGETNGRYRFVNNTIIADQAAVFRYFDGIESIQMHNNIFYRDGGSVDIQSTSNVDWTTGSAVIAGSNNWVTSGAIDVPSQWTGTLTGADPGFEDFSIQDFRPGNGSPLLDEGNNTPPSPSGYEFISPLWPPVMHPFLSSQLNSMATTEARTSDGAVDIGAYEMPCEDSGKCAASPVADFSASTTHGSEPLTVIFTDISTRDPTGWIWDFGDGQAATEQHPQHTYQNKGRYTVSLTVTNDEGSDTERKTNYISAGISSSTLLLSIPAILSAGNTEAVKSMQVNGL